MKCGFKQWAMGAAAALGLTFSAQSAAEEPVRTADIDDIVIACEVTGKSGARTTVTYDPPESASFQTITYTGDTLVDATISLKGGWEPNCFVNGSIVRVEESATAYIVRGSIETVVDENGQAEPMFFETNNVISAGGRRIEIRSSYQEFGEFDRGMGATQVVVNNGTVSVHNYFGQDGDPKGMVVSTMQIINTVPEISAPTPTLTDPVSVESLFPVVDEARDAYVLGSERAPILDTDSPFFRVDCGKGMISYYKVDDEVNLNNRLLTASVNLLGSSAVACFPNSESATGNSIVYVGDRSYHTDEPWFRFQLGKLVNASHKLHFVDASRTGIRDFTRFRADFTFVPYANRDLVLALDWDAVQEHAPAVWFNSGYYRQPINGSGIFEALRVGRSSSNSYDPYPGDHTLLIGRGTFERDSFTPHQGSPIAIGRDIKGARSTLVPLQGVSDVYFSSRRYVTKGEDTSAWPVVRVDFDEDYSLAIGNTLLGDPKELGYKTEKRDYYPLVATLGPQHPELFLGPMDVQAYGENMLPAFETYFASLGISLNAEDMLAKSTFETGFATTLRLTEPIPLADVVDDLYQFTPQGGGSSLSSAVALRERATDMKKRLERDDPVAQLLIAQSLASKVPRSTGYVKTRSARAARSLAEEAIQYVSPTGSGLPYADSLLAQSTFYPTLLHLQDVGLDDFVHYQILQDEIASIALRNNIFANSIGGSFNRLPGSGGLFSLGINDPFLDAVAAQARQHILHGWSETSYAQQVARREFEVIAQRGVDLAKGRANPTIHNGIIPMRGPSEQVAFTETGDVYTQAIRIGDNFSVKSNYPLRVVGGQPIPEGAEPTISVTVPKTGLATAQTNWGFISAIRQDEEGMATYAKVRARLDDPLFLHDILGGALGDKELAKFVRITGPDLTYIMDKLGSLDSNISVGAMATLARYAPQINAALEKCDGIGTSASISCLDNELEGTYKLTSSIPGLSASVEEANQGPVNRKTGFQRRAKYQDCMAKLPQGDEDEIDKDRRCYKEAFAGQASFKKAFGADAGLVEECNRRDRSNWWVKHHCAKYDNQ